MAQIHLLPITEDYLETEECGFQWFFPLTLRQNRFE